MTNHPLVARDAASIWHPFTPLTGLRPPLPVVAAQDCWLHLADGRRILDAISSWWVNLHGHAHPHLAAALARQAQQLEHVIFAGFTHEPAVQLAEGLLRILPPNQAKVFFSDNGSTATEVALKMAFQYFYNRGEQRPKVVALEGGYHGDTFGAMAVGDPSPFNAPFKPYLFEVEFLPFPEADHEAAALARLDALTAPGEVAAFIFEPLVQGASGMRMYRPEWLDQALALAQSRGVLCIADEVMTGFGRTGHWFASQYLTHPPDIMCLSKGITGGFMPLGVTTCTAAVQAAYRHDDLFKTFFHGHSYTANPLACAVANASLELLLGEACRESLCWLTGQQAEFAQRVAARYPQAVRQARALGTIAALEIAQGQASGYFNEARNALYYYFLDRDVLLRPLGNVLYVLPPYCITASELATVYQVIEEFLAGVNVG
ncbi:MAG: adenosylmethionine--8-amino-7-oxononanoate transaminase [Bernardetiaceae bacterium]|jgi:adenosylmethionine-8-amino-7-oxononanoate aminotransferase|nr:adenosylmethionine--8-amino-7-oxononanoate transaminase [Bernardetiaceae bacterium]